MKVISAQEALEVLKKNQYLSDTAIHGMLELNTLENEDFDILTGLSFSSCVFHEKVFSWFVYHREKVTFSNCIFKGEVTMSTFTFKELLFYGCQFYDYVSFGGCGFYHEFVLKDNVFRKFVNFEDSSIQGQTTIVNNQFKAGTNLMHPKGGPSGAHFAFPPYLEGNTGLDQYERPEG